MSGYYASSIESILEGMIPAAVRDGTGEKTQRMLESTELGSTEKGKQLVIRSPKQRLLLDHLIEKAAPVPLNETVKTLGVGQSVAKGLVAKGLAREKKDAVIRVAYCDELMDSVEEVYTEVKLTDEQSKASGEIKESLKANSFSTHLLLGITGSGKTEVYFEAMEEALSQGGSVLFLVPEVALAPQTVSRLRHRFSRLGEQVVVWHSHLSAGERLDAWSLITQGDARRGRRPVFAPVSNLRLVVVDEEHEPAYKQDESPRYHGRDAAVYRAMPNEAVCVPSATPSLKPFITLKGKIRQELIDEENRRTRTSAHSARRRRRESLKENNSHFVSASSRSAPPKVRRSGTKYSLPQPEGLQHNHALPGMRLCGTVQGLQYCNDLSPNRRLPEMPSLQLSKARSESMSGMPFIRHSKKRAWDAKNRGYRERPSSEQTVVMRIDVT